MGTMHNLSSPSQQASQLDSTERRAPKRLTLWLSLTVALQLAMLGKIWGQDPLLVNRILPYQEAWKQARREAQRARRQLTIGQVVPVLRVTGVDGAPVPSLTGQPTALLFVGQCRG
jgi:hypothetical protein